MPTLRSLSVSCKASAFLLSHFWQHQILWTEKNTNVSKLKILKYFLCPTNKEEALFFLSSFLLIILQNKNKIFHVIKLLLQGFKPATAVSWAALQLCEVTQQPANTTAISSPWLEEGVGTSLCLRLHGTCSTPSPFSRGELISRPNFCSWLLSTNKSTFVLGRRQGEQHKWNFWCRIFLSLVPLQKAARPAAASRQERADSLNKASSKTDLPFQGHTKRKRVGTLLKQWEVSFVGLKAEQRLTED